MIKTICFFLLSVLLSCGQNKPTIVGNWDVYRYETKGVHNEIMDFEPGEWTFEFTKDGKLITFKPGPVGKHTEDYTIKNKQELWLIDKGIQIPYIIKTLTSTELTLEDENEVIHLKRKH